MTAASAAPPVNRPEVRAAVAWVVVLAGTAVYTAAALLMAGGAQGAGRWLAVAGGALVLGAGWWALPRAPAAQALAALAVGAVVFRALLLWAPGGSTDAFRYVWDGRVQDAGINPYAYAPDDPELAALQDHEVWPRINRSDVRTVYPPAAQALFRLAHAAGVRSPSGFALLVTGVDLAAVGALAALLRSSGRHPGGAVAYAWHPVALLGFAHGAHLESVVVLLALAAVWAWSTGRLAWAGALVGLAASVKLLPLVLLPAVLRGPDGSLRPGRAAVACGAAAAVLAAGYVPFLGGADPLGYLPGYLAAEGYRDGARFTLLSLAGIDGRWAAPAVLAAVVALALRSRRHAAVRAAWLLGTVLVLATPPQSWYAAPLVALAAVGGAAAWVWFSAGLEAGYVGWFFRPDGLPLHLWIRGAAAAAVVALALVAARWPARRRLLAGDSGRGPA